MNRSSQQGFTLIELVAVIVLLGILAVTALPRFLNVQTDARIAVLNGVIGSMQGAAQQTYAKALIQGRTGGTPTTVTSTSGNISVIYGYPRANSNTALDIQGLVDLSGSSSGAASEIKFSAVDTNSADRFVGYDTDGDANVTSSDKCIARYSEATSIGGVPTVATQEISGC